MRIIQFSVVMARVRRAMVEFIASAVIYFPLLISNTFYCHKHLASVLKAGSRLQMRFGWKRENATGALQMDSQFYFLVSDYGKDVWQIVRSSSRPDLSRTRLRLTALPWREKFHRNLGNYINVNICVYHIPRVGGSNTDIDKLTRLGLLINLNICMCW